jgi:hypothetical protein
MDGLWRLWAEDQYLKEGEGEHLTPGGVLCRAREDHGRHAHSREGEIYNALIPHPQPGLARNSLSIDYQSQSPINSICTV